MKVMQEKIEDNSVDFIFTDVPYGIALDKKSTDGKIDKFRKSTKNTIITSDWDKFEDYADFSYKWMSIAYKKLKPKSWMAIWNHYSRIRDIHNVADKLNLRLADIFVWSKNNAPLCFPDGFTKCNEYCIVLNKTSKDKDYTRYMSKDIIRDFIVNPITSNKERKEGFYHPTIKPRTVLYPFITKFSKVNDLILDPFCGSASIPISCLETGRNFIGVEKDKTYYKNSLKRLEISYNRVNKRLTEW